MRKLFPVFGFLLFIILLNSCVSPSRLYYFNDKQPGKDTLDTVIQTSVQRIQKNDRLNITVSSTDPALTAYLNPFNITSTTGSAASGSQQANTGYLVNNNGTIEFPLLGTVKVWNLTTAEAAAQIKEKLSFFYKDLFVNVNLRGQVYFMNGRQGTPIPMINERLTILEAISQSGVQDPFDKKNEVWLVRENNEGIRTYAKLNLNSKSIFQSPYFYLQNNDLIYLQPGKFSSFLSPTSPVRSIITTVTAVLAVFIAVRNL